MCQNTAKAEGTDGKVPRLMRTAKSHAVSPTNLSDAQDLCFRSPTKGDLLCRGHPGASQHTHRSLGKQNAWHPPSTRQRYQRQYSFCATHSTNAPSTKRTAHQLHGTRGERGRPLGRRIPLDFSWGPEVEVYTDGSAKCTSRATSPWPAQRRARIPKTAHAAQPP